MMFFPLNLIDSSWMFTTCYRYFFLFQDAEKKLLILFNLIFSFSKKLERSNYYLANVYFLFSYKFIIK